MTIHRGRRSGGKKHEVVAIWLLIALGATIVLAAGWFTYSRFSDNKVAFEPTDFDSTIEAEASTADEGPETTLDTRSVSGRSNRSAVTNRPTSGTYVTDTTLHVKGKKVISIQNIPNQVAISNNQSYVANKKFNNVIVSPTGQHVAFSTIGDRGEGFGWVFDITNSANRPIPVTFSEIGLVRADEWSGDSTKVSFSSPQPNEINNKTLVILNDLSSFPRVAE